MNSTCANCGHDGASHAGTIYHDNGTVAAMFCAGCFVEIVSTRCSVCGDTRNYIESKTDGVAFHNLGGVDEQPVCDDCRKRLHGRQDPAELGQLAKADGRGGA